MDNKVYILHRSAIIQNGLAEILHHNFKCSVKLFSSFNEFDSNEVELPEKHLIIIEDNQLNDSSFNTFLEKNQGAMFIKIINSFTTSASYDSIYLYDNTKDIINKVGYAFEKLSNSIKGAENLSKREVDVLKLVAIGHSNKEIADGLNISTHTVMSHRKNITEKLGIKSVSGLTVYAIINNYIDTSNLNINELI